MNQQISEIAANTLVYLQPYLGTISSAAAEKLGEKLPDSIAQLWQSLKNRFNQEPVGKEILNDLIEHFDDSDYQAAFRAKLRKILLEDTEFQQELIALLKSNSDSASSQVHQSGHASFVVQGSNNVVEQKIGQVANRITNIGYQPKRIPANAEREFVQLMSSVPPLEIYISANFVDHETHFLAKQLTTLLQQAGWNAIGESLSVFHADMPKGLVFIANTETAESVSLDMLANFLRDVGFSNYLLIDDSANNPTLNISGVD